MGMKINNVCKRNGNCYREWEKIGIKKPFLGSLYCRLVDIRRHAALLDRMPLTF